MYIHRTCMIRLPGRPAAYTVQELQVALMQTGCTDETDVGSGAKGRRGGGGVASIDDVNPFHRGCLSGFSASPHTISVPTVAGRSGFPAWRLLPSQPGGGTRSRQRLVSRSKMAGGWR
jgi:hypothetical protein